MTYRERRERRAERLRGWAEARQQTASATLNAIHRTYSGNVAFNTQPGHIPERARVIAREDRAFESLRKAESMDSRAANIESQLDHAIYDDDPDAIERLTERIASLEAKREQIKAANAAYRKEHRAELLRMTAYQRDEAMPHAGWSLTNLSGNLSRQRARLDILKKRAAGIDPRYAKVAMIRRIISTDTAVPPLFLNCRCGANPPTELGGPDVTCACGSVYTYNGWRRS